MAAIIRMVYQWLYSLSQHPGWDVAAMIRMVYQWLYSLSQHPGWIVDAMIRMVYQWLYVLSLNILVGMWLPSSEWFINGLACL